MNCPRCNMVLPDGSVACSACGAQLGAPGMGMYGAPPVLIPRTSGMAIAGFVLSFLCSLLGLIFSIIGYNECKKSNGTVSGEGLALAGIIISIISMIIGLAYVAGGHHRF